VLRDRVRSTSRSRGPSTLWVERIDTYLDGRWNAHPSWCARRMSWRGSPRPALVCEGYRDLGMQGALRGRDTSRRRRSSAAAG
jgi:hypothetical protein